MPGVAARHGPELSARRLQILGRADVEPLPPDRHGAHVGARRHQSRDGLGQLVLPPGRRLQGVHMGPDLRTKHAQAGVVPAGVRAATGGLLNYLLHSPLLVHVNSGPGPRVVHLIDPQHSVTTGRGSQEPAVVARGNQDVPPSKEKRLRLQQVPGQLQRFGRALGRLGLADIAQLHPVPLPVAQALLQEPRAVARDDHHLLEARCPEPAQDMPDNGRAGHLEHRLGKPGRDLAQPRTPASRHQDAAPDAQRISMPPAAVAWKTGPGEALRAAASTASTVLSVAAAMA